MHFAPLLTLLLAALVTGESLSYDPAFDQGSTSLSTVSCSDGPNGLEPKYTTFSSLPTFPNIGGVPAIAGWNSPNCGTCWQLTYTPASANPTPRSIYLLGIDRGGVGFNIALAAMNNLTNNQAVALGRVDVAAVQVDSSKCLI
ncbi:snodprot1 [Amanita muscaria]